jgi:O-antigen/teichoic acid export membrane protein
MAIIMFSRIWGALLSIFLVPIYVKLLGVESYGLVAFYTTLSAALGILDVGLSASVIRQVAIYKTQNNKEKELKNLLFTVEILNWLIAIVAGVGIIILANPIATHWVKAKNIDANTIQQCVMLMGLVFAFQFPGSVYDGAMIGLQKQNANAILNILFTSFKAIAVLFVLYFIKSSVQLFFVCQAIVALIYTFSMRWYAYKKISNIKIAGKFSIGELKVISSFALNIAATSIVTFFITQLDKIIVSRNLEQLSYYSLAFLLAGAITLIISPMQSIIYPKLTQLVATKDIGALIKLYHKSCKWVSIIVFPIGLILIFFADEILFLWTKNEVLTTETAPILRVVVVGTLCNSMMAVPYYFTLAKGHSKYGLYQSIIFAIVTLPLLFWLNNKYGALGASFVWLIINGTAMLIFIPFINGLYFNKQELWNWFSKDFFLPLFISSLIVTLAKLSQLLFFPIVDLKYFIILVFLIIFIYVTIIPETRIFLKRYINLMSN